MRISTKKAFTLVEMLVVIVLLSMLIATAVFAYKNMIIHVKKTKRDNFKTLYNFNILRSSIGSMVYYVVEEEVPFASEGEVSVNLQYFFYGDPQQCTYITNNPLFSDAISVASLRCENGELRYYESLLYGTQDYKNPQIIDNAPHKTLFSDLVTCQFEYIDKDQTKQQLSKTLPNVVHITLKKESDALEHDYFFKIISNRYKTKNWFASEIYDEQQ